MLLRIMQQALGKKSKLPVSYDNDGDEYHVMRRDENQKKSTQVECRNESKNNRHSRIEPNAYQTCVASQSPPEQDSQ